MSGAVELLKWLGLAAMLYDHAELFAGVLLPYAASVGAFAFPFFAIALGAALGLEPSGKLALVVRRLFFWALIAQVVVVFVRDPMPLNVLFTLAAGVLAFVGTESRRSGRGAVLVLGAVGVSLVSEFSILGATFVWASLYVFSRRRQPLWLCLPAIPLYLFNEGSMFSVVAVVAAAALLSQSVSVPRVKRVFYLAYIAQWPLLRWLMV